MMSKTTNIVIKKRIDSYDTHIPHDDQHSLAPAPAEIFHRTRGALAVLLSPHTLTVTHNKKHCSNNNINNK